MKTFLEAKWQNIVMVNYEVEANVLQPFLPFGVELDSFQEKCFISLVGFRFVDSKIFGIPIPIFGSFDEVNLRFYVKRKIASTYQRGVVFISEVVPSRVVSFLANNLYKEHYSYSKMKHKIEEINQEKIVEYYWQKDNQNFFIKGTFENIVSTIKSDSLEEFIYEHYLGYTKVSESETWEYKVNHPKWMVNTLKRFEVNCDFEIMYGKSFSFLNHQKPCSVYNAIGSNVTIDWKINKLIHSN